MNAKTETKPKPKTDFEIEEEKEFFESVADDKGKDVDGIPYCRDHHCRMKRASGGRKGSERSYYACPVPDCESKAQMIRTKTEAVVPTTPQMCPRCKDVCERDAKVSSAALVILKCPGCGWKSTAMVTPALAAAQLAERERVKKTKKPSEPGIGER